MKQKNKKQNKLKYNSKMAARGRAFKALKKVEVEDTFLDENSKVNLEDAVIINPTRREVIDEVSSMDSFRDYLRESRGNSLTFGDY